MTYYKVPNKYLAKWIKCLDECVEIWRDRVKGECISIHCPACDLAPISRSTTDGEYCKCPLRGKYVPDCEYAGNCCDGKFGNVDEIVDVLNFYDSQANKYPSMTYEEGIEFALQWVVGMVTDKEFEESR